MDFKHTSTNRRTRSLGGFAVAELVVAVGITALLLMALASISMFSGRCFAALANYVELDSRNQIAMDTLTRDLREANRIKATTSSSITLEAGNGTDISYIYNSSAETLTRTEAGVSSVILRGCDTFSFSLGQRNPVGGSYDVYPAATVDTCKVVNVAWTCSRSILGLKENTESVQTARIVIRKQGT